MNKKDTLKVINFAADYENNITKIWHRAIDGKKVCFFANNKEIADFLQKDLTMSSFKRLFELSEKKGVFDLRFFHHIPSVSLNVAAKHMMRKWPRDNMGMMELMADKYSEEVWLGVVEWAKAYSNPKEVRAFECVYKNPQSACYNKGIAHVFWQDEKGNLRRDDKWKMHQRIESHGELLRYMALLSREELQKNQILPKEIVESLVRFTHYLYVQGISPQSCGAWEEIPFTKGINWDNVNVIKAFEEVILLIKELIKHSKAQKQFKDFEKELCNKFKLVELFGKVENIKEFIVKSMKLVRKYYLDDFHGISKRVDSSMVMLCAEGVNLSARGNLKVNIRKHLQILRRWEKVLVQEFGAWRYNKFSIEVDGQKVSSCDSYLNLNYYIDCDGEGRLCGKKKDIDNEEHKKSDCNGVKRFSKRGNKAKEKSSAQWGLPLSYAAIAYGKLVEKLLDKRDEKGFWDMEEQKLFAECFNKNQEYIKRTYGNISGCFENGEKFLKADGKEIEPFRKPEAYQAVTTELNTNKFAFIPGVNDHLGWDAAKCYEASKLFLRNLARIEKNNIF